MKNKTGIIIGFIVGFAVFMIFFKFAFLDHIPPEDELAPGIVVFIALLNGLLFAYAGSANQHFLIARK